MQGGGPSDGRVGLGSAIFNAVHCIVCRTMEGIFMIGKHVILRVEAMMVLQVLRLQLLRYSLRYAVSMAFLLISELFEYLLRVYG